MSKPDWNQEAEAFIRREVVALTQVRPSGYGAIVRYNEKSYTATIQPLTPGIDDEIVLLSTGLVSTPEPLVDAILQLHQGRPDLIIDPVIDFRTVVDGMPVIHYLRLRRGQLETLEGYQERLARRVLTAQGIVVEGARANLHLKVTTYGLPEKHD